MLYVLGSSVVYRFYNPDARSSLRGLSLRQTLALKSSNLMDSSLRHLLNICDRLASGAFLRLLGAYTCTGWALGTSKSSRSKSSIYCAAAAAAHYCAAAAAAHTPMCNRVASDMEIWVLHKLPKKSPSTEGTKKNYLNVDVEKRDIFGHNEVLPLVEQIPQVSGWVYVRSASKDVVNAVDSAIMKPYNLRLTPPSSLALVSMENINTGVQACIVGRIICKLNNCLHINIQSFKSPGHKRSMGG
ncbi:hypothetical protein BY996DRAFT_6414859 [Phakopsora pachyrhizi]|nr:hypothetical protein BY996DRAFT_6414859 [Phakopsora pachyrhizi]